MLPCFQRQPETLIFYFSLGIQVELNQITYAAIAALVIGMIMLISSSKTRNDAGEWSNGLQWGYLLTMIGIFGVLASGLKWSFTAVLLLFTLSTGTIWLWRKISHKNQTEPDSNHFRDYMAGFFPIIAVVFVLRTFVAEPFQIPSSSMRPGLVKGDFILVNKFAYGIRIPILNTVAIPTGKIERGDVVVFNYPVQPEMNFIKRIVAIGGDTIEYKNKILTVNGDIVEYDTPKGNYQYPNDYNANQMVEANRFQAAYANRTFDILKNSQLPSLSEMARIEGLTQERFNNFVHQCSEYSEAGFKCTVPEGNYFAMGDNRDNSADSRYWGFVPDNLIVGKAFFIWMNAGDTSRIGSSIK